MWFHGFTPVSSLILAGSGVCTLTLCRKILSFIVDSKQFSAILHPKNKNMKYIKLAIAAGIILISSCAQSIPETTTFGGKQMMVHLKATTNATWEFYINGELVITHKINAFEGLPVMNGTWRGKHVMIKMQMALLIH